MQNKNGQCKEFHKHVSVNSKEIQLTSAGSEKENMVSVRPGQVILSVG